MDPQSSSWPEWRSYLLDTDSAGNARHPHSLYIEAERPQSTSGT
jgi:hypothetical protein